MIWLAFLGMFLVTYTPRLVPLLLARELPFPPWVRRWMHYFPYAALGALIFPDILSAVPTRPWLAVAAGAAAAASSLLVPNLSVAVLAAIACVLLGGLLPLH